MSLMLVLVLDQKFAEARHSDIVALRCRIANRIDASNKNTFGSSLRDLAFLRYRFNQLAHIHLHLPLVRSQQCLIENVGKANRSSESGWSQFTAAPYKILIGE